MEYKGFVCNQKGAGILEVLFAALIITILALGIARYVSFGSRQSATLSSMSGCEDYARNIVESVRSLDNSLLVRNFVPNVGDEHPPETNLDEYFCRRDSNIGCDTLPHLRDFTALYNPNVQARDIYSVQNIRGASSWALAAYNRRKPQICDGVGMRFRSVAELNRILPRTLPPDPKIQEIQFSIQPEGPGLSSGAARDICVRGGNFFVSPAMNIGFRITARLDYRMPNQVQRYCQSSALLNFPADRVNGTLVSAEAPSPSTGQRHASCRDRSGTINLNRASEAPRAPAMAVAQTDAVCTCLKGAPNCRPEDIYTAAMDVEATEAGSNFFCQLRVSDPTLSTWTDFPDATNYQYCNQLGAAPTLMSMEYNKGTQARLNVRFDPLQGERAYQYKIKTVDASGNFSANHLTSVNFLTRTPVCEPRPESCPPTAPIPGVGGSTYEDTCRVPICTVPTIPVGRGCPPATAACLTPKVADACGNVCPCVEAPPCPTSCDEWAVILGRTFVPPDRGDLACVPTCTGPGDCPAPFRWGCNNCYAGTPQNQPNLRTVHLGRFKSPACIGVPPNYCFEPANCPGM